MDIEWRMHSAENLLDFQSWSRTRDLSFPCVTLQLTQNSDLANDRAPHLDLGRGRGPTGL